MFLSLAIYFILSVIFCIVSKYDLQHKKLFFLIKLFKAKFMITCNIKETNLDISMEIN